MSVASSRRATSASQAGVAEAALVALTKGNAVDAVVAGVFAAAAMSPSVLLGPVQVLVGGAGAGVRAVDGRNHQPGRGVARPRGFLSEDEIPPAARVAAPALVAALAAALATCGIGAMRAALGPALELAPTFSEPRARLLKRIAQSGALALSSKSVAEELIAAAGRIAGGVLSQADLDDLRPVVTTCAMRSVGERGVATVPWGAEAVRDAASEQLDASHVEIVAAADGRGLVAVACYEVAASDDGLVIAELGLVAPPGAKPVMRGETRVRPGEPRAAAAPIALSESEGIIDVALGVAHSARAEHAIAEFLAFIGRGETIEAALIGSSTDPHAMPLVAGVARTRVAARAFRSG